MTLLLATAIPLLYLLVTRISYGYLVRTRRLRQELKGYTRNDTTGAIELQISHSATGTMVNRIFAAAVWPLWLPACALFVAITKGWHTEDS